MAVGRAWTDKAKCVTRCEADPTSPRATGESLVRVVVFDCDDASRADLTDALRHLGYDVAASCATFDGVLREVEWHHPQLVVAGFNSDHCEAVIEAAAYLRDRLGMSTVFVTDCADSATLERARQVKPVGYVLRPVSPAALRVAVELGFDRRAIEHRLVHRQAFLEAMFEWAGVGIAVLDEHGWVLQTNRTLDGLLDLAQKGRARLESLSHPDVAPRERRLFRQLIAGKRAHYRFECRYLRSNEEIGVGYVSATRLDGGEHPRVIRVMSDISYARLEKIASFQENERHLISSEVHDAVSQPLAGVFYRLQATQQILDADLPRAHAELTASLQVVQRLLEDLSRLIYNLRAPSLDGGNLAEALERLATDFRRETCATLTLELPPRFPELGRLQALFVYRILQESLANVRRHAGATRASVSLQPRGGHLEGRVEDDGNAPPAGYERNQESRRRHFGIRAMRERAELLGGRLQVRARSEGGTVVSFELPLNGEAHDE